MSMKFESLRMRSFGPFKDVTLDLGSGGGALHIVCGPNEAGKTTTQRAIGDFIFGIPVRTPDGHEFGFTEMRLEAAVIDGKKESHRLVRRKGKGNTLLDPDGTPVDEGLLSEMLGGLTREAFASMFSITHQSLVDGGRALLAADGNLGESLFSASLGAAGLHDLRVALTEEADELFRPKATSTQIAKVRSDLAAAEGRLAEATLRTTPYLKLVGDLEAAELERRSIADDLQSSRGEQMRRDRLRVVLPKILERDEAIERLAEIGESPPLAPDSEERRLRIEQDLITHRELSDKAARRVETLAEDAAELRPDEKLLAREQAITDLASRLSLVAEARVDLERQSTKAEVSRADADRVLAELSPAADSIDPGQLRVGDVERARVSVALQAHSRISGRLEEAVTEEEEARASAEALQRRLAAAEAPEGIVGLRAAAGQVRPDSSLEARIADLTSRLAETAEELALALSDLRPPVELGVLTDLDWPDAAELEPFATRWEELDSRARDLMRQRQANAHEAAEFNATSAPLGADELPQESDLTESRSARDVLWGQARANLEGRGSPVDPDDFERRVHAADRVADLLREQADKVAVRAQNEERKAANRVAGARIEGEEARLAEDRHDLVAGWKELWRPYALEPRPPREMESWLGRRSLALERSRTVAQLERELETCRSRLADHVSLMLSVLGADHDAVVPGPDATLGVLLALADDRMSTALEVAERRDRLGHDLDARRAEADRQLRRAEARKTELGSWEDDWAQITSSLGWPRGIPPEEATDRLDRVVDLTNHLDRAEESERRRRGIEDRLTQFESEVSALFAQIDGADLGDRGHADAVADLARRLDAAKELRRRRADVGERLELAKGDLAAARSDLARAEAGLRALMEKAGVNDPADLAPLERRSEQIRLLEGHIPRLEEEIVAAGKASLDELLAACRGIEVDELDARSKGAEEEIARVETTLREADVRIGTLDSERRQMESAAPASISRQKVENLRAELASLAEDYLCAHVASWALGRAIDDYRSTHKAPLLARAEELFPRLTNGRYRGLEVDFADADQPVLVGVKADGKRLSVKQMSEGPREQLYLSLRQASIERHVALHGAVPVVLDDVVLHSDPGRKKAILRSLAELAERTQVIAFSHDPQVVALAQASVHPDLLKVHEFGEGGITGELQSEIAKADVHTIRFDRAA